jgi:hypothetical protein
MYSDIGPFDWLAPPLPPKRRGALSERVRFMPNIEPWARFGTLIFEPCLTKFEFMAVGCHHEDHKGHRKPATLLERF